MNTQTVILSVVEGFGGLVKMFRLQPVLSLSKGST